MNRWILASATVAVLSLQGCFVSTAPAPQTGGAAMYVPDVSGAWTTTWGSNVALLSLQQNGAQIQGAYTTTGAPNGNVSGTLDGNVLNGQWWDQGGSRGSFRFTYAGDARSFSGTWGMGNDAYSGGNWDGSR